MVISVKDFKTKFIGIFGDEIWDDFIKYGRSKQNTISFKSMHEVVRHLSNYKEKFFEARNFYEHKPYTRFVLISIERAFRRKSRLIKFAEKMELDNGYFNRRWEIEHIFPQSGYDNIFKRKKIGSTQLQKRSKRQPNRQLNRCKRKRPYRKLNNRSNKRLYWPYTLRKIDKYIGMHRLNNLTLISRKLNGDKKYKTADFQIKKYIMNCSTENYTEKDFYINRIFKDRKTYERTVYEIEDYVSLLKNRGIKLKRDFNRIFVTDKFRITKPDELDIPIIFFRDVLGYSKSDIKSTFHITPLKRKRLK